jgi:hypothetical protein
VETGRRFVSALALYGPKAGPVRDFLAGVQALIAEHADGGFRPYSLDQIHATLIALDGARDPATGRIVNAYFLQHAGLAVEMDLPLVMRILEAHFADPLAVRIGGHLPGRGAGPYERAFTVRPGALVLVGSPVTALCGGGRPLDKLRRDMNAANVLHKYHRRDDDVDDDFYLVVGHHAGVPADVLGRAAAAVREKLAAGPLELAIGLRDVMIVASDSATMAPAVFAGGIPADEAIVAALM